MESKEEDHGTAGSHEEDEQGGDDTMVPGRHTSSCCCTLDVAPVFSQVGSLGSTGTP